MKLLEKEVGSMKRTLKLVSTVVAFSLLLNPSLVLAQGFQSQVGAPIGTQGGNDLGAAIINILNVLLVLVALAALIMVIIGGVRYITSSGDEEQAESAKRTILYALIGLVVIGLAAVLVNFVLSSVAPPAPPII